LSARPGMVEANRMSLGGLDLMGRGEAGWLKLRGRRLSMVMQDPKYSLNPVLTIGRQIAETYRLHRRASKEEAKRRATAMLEAVKIREPDRVYHFYPHQLSGGMGQRAMTAMML